jgi:DNA-directed RNA polymerase subunit RPC12/RpoP
MREDIIEQDVKPCIECGTPVPELQRFPGPRCLACHARKVEREEPVPMPDFRRIFGR